MRALALALATASCVSSDAVPCGATLCPPGTQCRQLTNPDQPVCATPEQVAACAGLAEGAECGESAECRDGMCWSFTCGDGRVDRGEACDDGNTIEGDGCSSDCRSAEVCGNGIVDPIRRVVLPDQSVILELAEQCDDGNRIEHDGCNSHCEIELPHWTNQDLNSTTETVTGAAAAFDAARGNVVVFGGQTQGAVLYTNATRIWQGTGWTTPSPIRSPQPRVDPAMAYDAATRRVVLFGGVDQTNAFSETWEWDGQTWVRDSLAVAPDPRGGAGIAYDIARRRIVLFGGYRPASITQLGLLYNDTWEWDGAQWAAVTPSGPSPSLRAYPALAYDPVHGRVIAFGGVTSFSVLGDTWSYDGVRWTQLSPPVSPPARGRATLAWDVKRQQLVLYGGRNLTGDLADTWAWDGQTWSVVGTTPPAASSGHVMASDLDRERIVMFGLPSSSATWEWDGADWRDVTPLGGVPRPSPTVFDSARSRAVSVGSDTIERTEYGWVRLLSGTPNRQETAAAFDAKHAVTVMFGGLAGAMTSPATSTWNGSVWTTLSPLTSPPARRLPAMVYDLARSEVILFGGVDSGSETKNDTWRWDGVEWHDAAPAHAPPPRQYPMFAYDPLRDRAILYGGTSMTGVFLADTWSWDGTDWTEVAGANQPGALTNGTLIWNPSRQRLVLYGGLRGDHSFSADAWEWDGSRWTLVPIDVSPPERAASVMFPAPHHGVAMSSGTTGQFPPNDQWLLTWDAGRTTESCRLDVDDDGDGLAGCADPDCGYVCAPDCLGTPAKPGMTTCDDTLPHCGDGVCSAVENCRICPSDCACTPLCGDYFCDAGETTASCPGDCP